MQSFPHPNDASYKIWSGDIQVSSENLWQNDRIRKDKANPV